MEEKVLREGQNIVSDQAAAEMLYRGFKQREFKGIESVLLEIDSIPLKALQQESVFLK